MLCLDIPADLKDVMDRDTSSTYETAMIAFLWLTQYLERGDVYSGHTETGKNPNPKS